MRFCTIMAFLIVLAPAAFTATIKVPADYPTIQQAINAAVDGDTVLVSPGTYVENIDFKGKAITVTSSEGAMFTQGGKGVGSLFLKDSRPLFP